MIGLSPGVCQVGPGLRGPVGLKGALPLLDGHASARHVVSHRPRKQIAISAVVRLCSLLYISPWPRRRTPVGSALEPNFRARQLLCPTAAIGPQAGGLKVSCRIAKLHPNFAHFLPLPTPACGMRKRGPFGI